MTVEEDTAEQLRRGRLGRLLSAGRVGCGERAYPAVAAASGGEPEVASLAEERTAGGRVRGCPWGSERVTEAGGEREDS